MSLISFFLLASQHNFRNAKHVKMMLHPYSSAEDPAEDTVGATARAPQATLSRTEAEKEEETLKNLVDVLHHVMRNDPSQGALAPRSAATPTRNDTVDALWLKVYKKHAEKPKKPGRVAMTRKPTPSTMPSVLTLQADPDFSAALCVFESAQLTAALEELAFILQAVVPKGEDKILDQLISGFSEIFKECFKKSDAKNHN